MRKITALKSLFVGALLAISSWGVVAGTVSFGNNGVAPFSNELIAPNLVGITDGLVQDFTFTGLANGTYNIVGDISASNMTFTSVLLNSTPWELFPDSRGRLRFGSIEVTDTQSLTVHVIGTSTNTSANYSGSLTVTMVPEPTSTAMLLGGLALIGTIIRRRNKADSA